MRDVVFVYVVTRAFIWVIGLLSLAVFGWLDKRGLHFDPASLCKPGSSGVMHALTAPGCRFDASWFLTVADDGYSESAPVRSAFFPLYPTLTGLLGTVTGNVLAGFLISWSAAIVFLYFLSQQVAKFAGYKAARSTLWIYCLLPTSIFMSAIYSESLFLLLSALAIWLAHKGNYRAAGIIGFFAALCRSVGVLLVVPLAVQWLVDRRKKTSGSKLVAHFKELPLNRDDFRKLAWLALIPFGYVVFSTHLYFAVGDFQAATHAQDSWGRVMGDPFTGFFNGVWAVVREAGALIGVSEPPELEHANSLSDKQVLQLTLLRDSILLSSLLIAIALLKWAYRRMPTSWLAWGVVCIVYPLFVPSDGQPLMSMPRFVFASFPIVVALGMWASEKRRMRWVAPVNGVLLAAWTALFVTWTSAN